MKMKVCDTDVSPRTCIFVPSLTVFILVIYLFTDNNLTGVTLINTLLRKGEQKDCPIVLRTSSKAWTTSYCYRLQACTDIKRDNTTLHWAFKNKINVPQSLTDILYSKLGYNTNISHYDDSNQLQYLTDAHLSTTRNNATRFITVTLPVGGRVGNRMFQVAVLFGLANLTGHVPVLPKQVSPLNKVFDLPRNIHKNINTSRFKVYNQSGIHAPKDFQNVNWAANVTFSGYFHYYKTFYHLREKLLDVFRFKAKYVTYSNTFISGNVPKEHVKVGIHVRRGDYLSQREKNSGRLTPTLDYYKEAMEFYRCMYVNVTFIIVTDDKLWCRTHFNTLDTIISNHTDAGADLALMSRCDHTIMSVGTFGWWGGWLAGGNVVYYGQPNKPGSKAYKRVSMDDIYPPEWISLS